MDFNQIDELTSEESKANAEKAQANQRAEAASLAQAYARLFGTEDGQRVIADLSQRMIYDNNTQFSEANINYVAAYRNGEAGAIKYIIRQITQAREI